MDTEKVTCLDTLSKLSNRPSINIAFENLSYQVDTENGKISFILYYYYYYLHPHLFFCFILKLIKFALLSS